MPRRARRSADTLVRGDAAASVSIPSPRARTTIVAHILYLGGPGRPTPFTSTTESQEIAENFAGTAGRVWRTDPATAAGQDAMHVPLRRLLADIKGRGRGECAWDDVFEVAQARARAERWSEHLLDWRRGDGRQVAARVAAAFRP